MSIEENSEQAKKVIRIRVEADRLVVEEMATRLSDFIERQGFEILDQSRLISVQNDAALGRVFILAR
jgi:uncharacterized protein YabE (DUF348 family)